MYITEESLKAQKRKSKCFPNSISGGEKLPNSLLKLRMFLAILPNPESVSSDKNQTE